MPGIDRRGEHVDILDDMIGWHYHQHLIIVCCAKLVGDEYGRRRISARGLANDHAGLRAQFVELRLNRLSVTFIRNDNRRIELVDAIEALDCLLKQAELLPKSTKLLRQCVSRHWPKACARTTGENHRSYFHFRHAYLRDDNEFGIITASVGPTARIVMRVR